MHLITQLQRYFTDSNISSSHLNEIHRGRFANAVVYRFTYQNHDLIIKDFQHSPWLIKKTYARWSINQELKALERLKGIAGISDTSYRLTDIAFAYCYIEGESLRSLKKSGKALPISFFQQFEKMVSTMHQRGLVHLDLRNMGNVLCGKDGNPYIIDFQSSITFARFPRWLQKFMRGADLTGVYKAWELLGEQSLPPYRQQLLTNYNHIRKRWIFRGYPIHRAQLWLAGIFTQISNSDLVKNLSDKIF